MTETRKDKIFFALIPVFIVLVLGTVGTIAVLDVRSSGGISSAKGVVADKEFVPAHVEHQGATIYGPGEDTKIPDSYYLVIKTDSLFGGHGRELVQVDASVWRETQIGAHYEGPLDARQQNNTRG
jgi:hypothetical protein